ncbi:hypothetical protein [Aquicoccus sp. SU-CL01552]|uniref:hypothetical protein n=1 Tax=Aquicoccus sp. SU-CL01552 TaxID=3127656 RepID=UPI0031028605
MIFAVDHSKFVDEEGAGLLGLGTIAPRPVIVTDRPPARGAPQIAELAEVIVAG